MENATILLPQAVNGILSFPNMVRNRMTVNAGVIFESAKSNFGTSEFRPLSGRWVVERNNIFHYVFCGTKVTIASATRRASLSACFGHNGAPLLPHCANKSAQRLTAWSLTYIVEPALDDFGGYTAHHCVSRDIFCYDRSGSYHCVVTNRHTLKDGGIRAYPYVAPENNRSGVGITPSVRIEIMVESSEHHVMPDLGAISEHHSAMILEMTAGIDEDSASDNKIFPKVGVERREHLGRDRNFHSGKVCKQSVDLFLRVVLGIEAESDTPGFLAHVVHEAVYSRRGQRPAFPDMFVKLFKGNHIQIFNGARSICCDILTVTLSRATGIDSGCKVTIKRVENHSDALKN